MRCPGYWMKLPDDKTSMHGHAVHWMHMCTWNMTGFAGQETLPPSAGRLPLRTWCSITRAAPGTVWFAARGISAGVLSRSYAVKGVSAAWGPRPPSDTLLQVTPLPASPNTPHTTADTGSPTVASDPWASAADDPSSAALVRKGTNTVAEECVAVPGNGDLGFGTVVGGVPGSSVWVWDP